MSATSMRPRVAGAVRCTTAVNVALIGVLAWLGFVLAWPGDTFGTAKQYRALAAIMPEEGWSAAFLLAGIVGVLGLRAPKPLWRASLVVLCMAHGAMAGLWFVGNPLSTGSGVYAILAALGYYVLWRSGHG